MVRRNTGVARNRRILDAVHIHRFFDVGLILKATELLQNLLQSAERLSDQVTDKKR